MAFPKIKKRVWERDGGQPNIHGKGAVSVQIRDVATSLLWHAQEHICVLCGQPMIWPHFARDHVEPFSLSRDDTLWNTRLAHVECDKFRRRRPYNPVQRARYEASEKKLVWLLSLLASPRDIGPSHAKPDESA